MGVYAGPEVVNDGLVLSLDAGSLKSYDRYENLFDYSEQFDNAYWAKINSTLTSNQIAAPDGTLTADKWVANVSADSRLTTQQVRPDATYTFSFYVKSAGLTQFTTHILGRNPTVGSPEARILWDLSAISATLEIGSASISIQSVGNGWFRCIAIYTKSGTSTDLEVRPLGTLTGDGTSGLYIWGAQLERNLTSSPYYPTAGTSKTRGTILTDLSGNGNTGTLTNGPTFNSSNGGSIVFDGVNDYVAPTGLTDSFWQGNWTVNFWVNFTTLNTTTAGANDKTLLQHGTPALRQGLHLCQRNSRLHLGLYSDDLTSSIVLNTGKWYNVIFTLNNTTYVKQHYLNGTLDTFHTGGGPYVGTGNNARICGVVLNFGQYFDGFMSSCSFYNRVLTASEIQQNFNATRGRFGI